MKAVKWHNKGLYRHKGVTKCTHTITSLKLDVFNIDHIFLLLKYYVFTLKMFPYTCSVPSYPKLLLLPITDLRMGGEVIFKFIATTLILGRNEQWTSAEKNDGVISCSLLKITEWAFYQDQGRMNIIDIAINPTK